jgi:hypothetical protein
MCSYILTYKPHGPLLQDTCFEMGTRVLWDQELQSFDRFATRNLEMCVKLQVGMQKKELNEIGIGWNLHIRVEFGDIPMERG